jgi:hypothetical protein
MHRSGKRIRKLLGAALAGVAALAVVAAPAQAAPQPSEVPGKTSVPGESAIDAFIQQMGRDFVSRQSDLDAFKSWILTRPGIAQSGYIESVNDPSTKSTTLLWHGDTTLQKSIVREGARRGIAVTIKQRRYGLKEIDAAIAATWRSAEQGAWQGFKISHIVGVDADYDGIVVWGEYSSSLRAATTEALGQAAAATAGIPVRVEPGTAAVPDVATRSNDYAAFNAGGYMISPTSGHTCSTGFSIWISSVRHTTTARHCTENNYRARDGSATYGTGVLNSGDGGARVLSQSGSSLMFDGAWNNSAGYTKTVDSFGDVGLNDYVCTSGGNSGVHCGIKVDATRVSFNDGFGSFSTIHGTQQNSGQIASIQGDSGGPVLTLAGAGRVHAAGMDQGHDLGVSNCGSVHDLGSNTCGRGVFFTSMRTIVNSISGASLVTG